MVVVAVAVVVVVVVVSIDRLRTFYRFFCV